MFCAGNPASSETKSTQLGKSFEQWAAAAVRSDKKWEAWGKNGLERLENARLEQLLVINLIFAIIQKEATTLKHLRFCAQTGRGFHSMLDTLKLILHGAPFALGDWNCTFVPLLTENVWVDL